jgi:hypothetical protein
MIIIICEIGGIRWQIDASIVFDESCIINDMANEVENLLSFEFDFYYAREIIR